MHNPRRQAQAEHRSKRPARLLQTLSRHASEEEGDKTDGD